MKLIEGSNSKDQFKELTKMSILATIVVILLTLLYIG